MNFDEAEVLQRALEVFWVRGYEATSVSDLLEATGLKKGSLYQAFGDKRALFLRTLRQHLEHARAAARACLRGEGPVKSRVGEVLHGSLAGCQGDPKTGCYAVNCLVELAPHDTEVRGVLGEHFRAVEALIAEALERGRCRGELAPWLDPSEQARLLLTLLTGALAGVKGELSAESAHQLLDVALHQLLVAPPRA